MFGDKLHLFEKKTVTNTVWICITNLLPIKSSRVRGSHSKYWNHFAKIANSISSRCFISFAVSKKQYLVVFINILCCIKTCRTRIVSTQTNFAVFNKIPPVAVQWSFYEPDGSWVVHAFAIHFYTAQLNETLKCKTPSLRIRITKVEQILSREISPILYWFLQ